MHISYIAHDKHTINRRSKFLGKNFHLQFMPVDQSYLSKVELPVEYSFDEDRLP